jgi:hypothetical protein
MTIATATARLYDSSFVIGPFRRRAAIRELAEAADPSGLVRLGEALGKGHPNAGRIAGVLRQLSPESDAVKVRALWHAWAGAPTPAVAAVLARLGWPPGPVAEAKTVREVLAAARAGTAPDILKAVALFARALPVGD